MITAVDTLPAEMPLSDAIAFFGQPEHPHRAYPVVDGQGVLVGVIDRSDALRWRGRADVETQTLYDIVSDASSPSAHPEDTVGRVTDLMITEDVGRVPVVEATSGRLVGLIARKDLLRLREKAITSEQRREAFFRRPAAG
jgi:CBS domain-containing protein